MAAERHPHHPNDPFPLVVGRRQESTFGVPTTGFPVYDQNGWCRGWGATPYLARCLAEDIEDGRIASPILEPILYYA